MRANNGTLKLEVNGKEVSGVSDCKPRKGYLALESEGSECRFRNFKMTELPSTNPKPEECATLDMGHVSLFTGLTLDGWECEKDTWKVGDGTLRAAKASQLKLTKKLPKGELVFDYRLPAKTEGKATLSLGGTVKELNEKPGAWHRMTVPVDGEVVFTPVVGMELRSLFAK